MMFSRCRPYSPIEVASEQSGRANSTGTLRSGSWRGSAVIPPPEVADLVRQPTCGGAGAADDLGQFVAEQEDRQALEPADHRVGP
jgi:hypothetical protein